MIGYSLSMLVVDFSKPLLRSTVLELNKKRNKRCKVDVLREIPLQNYRSGNASTTMKATFISKSLKGEAT